MNRNINVDALILVGKDALVVPALAMVGVASIVGATTYGAYRLGQKIAEKIFDKKCEETETES